MKLCLETNHPSELIVAYKFGSAHDTDGKLSPDVGNIVPYASRRIRCRDLILWTTLVSALCAVSTAVLQRHLGSQRTRGKVKSGVSLAVALPLPASFPAGQSPAASTEHASLLLREEKNQPATGKSPSPRLPSCS